MKLIEMLKETEALTYINALKVTITELKQEIGQQELLREHMNQSSEKTKKLLRRADNQYRLIAKIVTREPPVASDITIQDQLYDLEENELRELMENG